MTMPLKLQRFASAWWPVTLIVLFIVTPFLVRKSYNELKDGGGPTGRASNTYS
jgi:hypothetical protein